MAFEIALENAADVTPECLARAIDLVVRELEGSLIESIWFGDDFLSVETFGQRHHIDFPVIRTGDHHAH